MTTYDRVRAKIIQAVPEIVTHCTECTHAEIKSHYGCTARPIKLDDVFLAIEKTLTDAGVYTKQPYFDAFTSLFDGPQYWQLGKDLSEQSPETITFLDNLIRYE